MAQMTQIELLNWQALYLATSICCALAVAMAAGAIGYQTWRARAWLEIDSAKGAILFLPRLWWKWQRLYFTSMPATLAVVGLFALSLQWK